MATLRKRGEVWYSDFTLGGKRIVRALDTDKREAQRKLDQLVDKRDAHKFGRAPKDSDLASFIETYLAHRKGERNANTIGTDRRALEGLRGSGVERLSAVTPLVLDQHKAALVASGVSHYSVNRRIRAIKTAMRKAEAWGYLPPQPWRSVGRIKEPKGSLRYYSLDELKALREVCSGVWLTAFMVGLYSGLRASEIWHLDWADVDFQRGRLHVSPKEGWSPKDNERRWVPMPEALVAYLKAVPKKGRGPMAGITQQSLSAYFCRLVRKAGLDGGLHTLRHTYGAELASAGVSLYIISKLLGHSSIKTTEIYAHLSPESLESAVSHLPTLDP